MKGDFSRRFSASLLQGPAESPNRALVLPWKLLLQFWNTNSGHAPATVRPEGGQGEGKI